METTNYHMKVGQAGRARRIMLNQLTNPETVRFLLKSGIKPGMKVLDIGCGMGIMTCWLSEIIGKTGEVVGIDSSEEQLAIAREIAEEEERNVTFKCMPATDLNSLDMDFDFIFCRFLLVHLKNPKKAVQDIFSLLKPGGIFACQSAIYGRELCYPESLAFNKWSQLRYDVFTALGKDPQTGEKVHTYMHETGFRDLTAELSQPVLETEKSRSEMILSDIIEQEALWLSEKLITEEELVNLKDDLTARIADSSYFMAYHQSAQVLGVKPAI